MGRYNHQAPSPHSQQQRHVISEYINDVFLLCFSLLSSFLIMTELIDRHQRLAAGPLWFKLQIISHVNHLVNIVIPDSIAHINLHFELYNFMLLINENDIYIILYSVYHLYAHWKVSSCCFYVCIIYPYSIGHFRLVSMLTFFLLHLLNIPYGLGKSLDRLVVSSKLLYIQICFVSKP